MPEGSSGRPSRARKVSSAKNKAGILDAHVRFELDRWSAASLEESLAEEVAALFAWLRTVRVAEVVTEARVSTGVAALARAQPADFERSVYQGARAVHEALQRDETTLAELLPREDYNQLVAAIIGMHEIRQEMIAEVMTSSVYSQLVAHELYHGIKNYILKENVLARRVPGASSLLRLGQSAFSSASPNLEKSIDRQLESFINANVQETIRDSQHHLSTTLDAEMLWSVADEFWAERSDENVATTAGRLGGSSLDELLEAARSAWVNFSRTPFFDRMAELLVGEFFRAHGDTSVVAFLADLGITKEVVVREVSRTAEPVLSRARESGYLESRIRSRLDAFYSTYFRVDETS